MDEHEALNDIKTTVHRIDSDLRSYRDEQMRQRADISKIEARQETMHEVHVRLEQKIDTVGATLSRGLDDVRKNLGGGLDKLSSMLSAHTTKEDEDRGKIMMIGWGLLLSLLAYLGVLMFEHFLVGK